MDDVDNYSVLVVDDDPPIRRLLERVARRAGFDVDCAKDGVQALEMLARKHYRIAIVDLMMPRLSGYELVQRIARLDPRPQVVVATAMGNTDVATLDDSLIRRVIRKPFDIEALTRILVELVGDGSGNRAASVPGVTVAPPELTAVPPEMTIAAPDVATLPVIESAAETNAAVDPPSEDKANELPPPTDELQGC